MDREKILLYSEDKENREEPEHFLGMGQMCEPGCGCFWEPEGICNSLLAISIIVC